MKKLFRFYLAALLMPIVYSTTVKAQAVAANSILQLPPAHVTTDGSLSDWGDSLRYYNEPQKLYYTLANDHDNLYMAVRISDHSEQRRILISGLTLSINTKGKTKETYSLTFPVAEPNSTSLASMIQDNNVEGRDLNGNTEQPVNRDEILKAHLTKLRYMKVSGFKDVENDMITTANTYGFKAAINYDANGYLICEAAIPLKFFNPDELYKNEWSFNIKINGITRPEGNKETGKGSSMAGGGMPRGGMSRGGMGGGRRGGGMGRGGFESGSADRSELFKSVDFWEKFYLSKS